MAKKKQYDCNFTEAEWTIMQIVWETEPCTAPDMQEALQEATGWAYTTVKTLMDRMCVKGYLTAKKTRNLYFYSSAVSQKKAKGGELKRTLRRAFNGSLTPMMQFLFEDGGISETEIKEIEQLIRSKHRRRK